MVRATWDPEDQTYNVTSQQEGEEELAAKVRWEREGRRFSLSLEELEYDWTNYSLAVRMISARADQTDERLWSRPVWLSERTLPSSPDFPPRTAPGTFQAVEETGGRRTVWVYWSQLEVGRHNGPGFNYSARALLNRPQSQLPVLLTPSFAQFPGLPATSGLNFSVSSYNEAGGASQSSRVFVPSQDIVESSAPTSVTTIYSSEDQSYKVSWFPPSSSVTSYTIFWCETHTSLPSQCSGQSPTLSLVQIYRDGLL